MNGQAHRAVIQRLAEKDSGDPRTLRDFLKWGVARYPAANHLLVVWSHGSGVRSRRRDIAYDDFGSSLNMPEIDTALRRAGISPRNRLQIVGFDACLMNMVEVVHHFGAHAEIIVGSQQTEPGDGWPYHRVLRCAKAAKTPERLARDIVREYINDYRRLGMENVTQSAVRVSATQAVVGAVHVLGNLLARKTGSDRQPERSSRRRSPAFSQTRGTEPPSGMRTGSPSGSPPFPDCSSITARNTWS